MSTKINWTNETWNPIIGCEKISPGCKNCYAEKMAKRLCAMGQENYFPVVDLHGWTGKTNFAESQLEKPLKWKKPRMIFVVSMGDLFHESIPFIWTDKVMEIIKQCPQHTFQILTKRPDRMHSYFTWEAAIGSKILNNVWLGITAENQEQADKRIPILLQIPAKVRFVSVEPMLSAVDLTEIHESKEFSFNSLHTKNALDWVICGGESGHNARLMNIDWALSLRDQCKEANVPFFFKQGSQNNWMNYKDFDSFHEDLKIRQMPLIKN